MLYLLDTNICVYIINQRPAAVMDRFKRTPVSQVAMSVVTFMELQYGVAKSANPERNQLALDVFVAPIDILPLRSTSARIYGDIRAALERQGTPIGALDLQIAAHALSERRTLITNNTDEFVRVPGLAVENWA